MRKFLLVLLSFLCPVVAYSQQPISGMPPFGSFQMTGFDTVNRYNMNANFAIPIVSSAGRGVPFNFSVVYDSSVWTHYSVSYWTTNIGGGWKTSVPAGLLTYSTSTGRCDTPPPYHSYTRYFNFRYTDAAGTTHPIALSYYGPNVCGLTPVPPRSAYASDASGYYAYASTAQNITITAKSGTVNGTPQIIDSNGNVVSSTVNGSETDWTDSAGHLALKVITSSSQIQYEYPDTSGTYQVATLKLQSYNVKTNFACSGITEYTGTQSLPYELDLANGQKYTFSYEATPGNTGYVTGRVQRVTLPAGGYYEYDYGVTNDGIYCSDGSTVSMNRVVNDGTTSNTWQFSRTPSGSNQVTTVTDPASNAATYTFNTSAQETSEKHYQGSTSGTLLRTVNLTWATNGTPATAIAILEDNSTQNEMETSYDNNGNLLTLKEHDWGTGGPGAILRTTTNTYLSTSPYTAANILDRVTRTTLADSTGTVKYRADITYDDSGHINTPCITGAAQHDDSGHGCSYTVRGNPTSLTTYTDAHTPAGGVTKNFTYDSLGNLAGADMDCCQHKQWNYSATTNYAYPDSIVRGPSGTQVTTSYTYNAYTGLLTTSTDENSKVTTITYADPGHLNRITNIRRPDGNNITDSYNDTPLAASVTVTTPVQGTNVIKQITGFDGLGRTVTTTVQDASSNTYSIVQTQYDPLGRAYKTSNPYTGSPSYFTTTTFDALSRITSVVTPDGATAGTTSYSYSTNATTVTDPSGKQRKTQLDGLGRLVTFFEPDVTNSNQLTVQTSYTYTVFNALATITQGSQTRTYAHDDMGRLTSIQIPEAGQVAATFLYNSFDLVTQRTDPRGVITTYGYDGLNRLQSISYNVGGTGVPATPSIGFTYGTSSALNNVNRLLTMTDGVGSETYSYDPNLPLLTQVQKVVGGTTYTTGYGYNLAGELASITYPSGRGVTQSYDAIGRLSTIATGGTNYSSSYAYNTASQVTGFTYGNGVTASFGYSPDRLQLTSLNYTKSGQTLFGLNYWYKQDTTNCPNAPTGNDGIIQCITDSVDQGRNATYTFDALARLSTAVTNGSTSYPRWGLSWAYDRYANRTAQSISTGCVAPMTCPTNSVAVDVTTNRISTPGYGYDLNGNMINDGLNTLVYDAESRPTSSSGSLGSATYTYDGHSLRVKKVSGSTTTVYAFSGSRVIAEYVNGAAPSAPTREYVYSGGALLAKIEGGAAQYYHQDLLSVRVMTDSSGNKIGEQGHFPFGESWYQSNTTTKWQFTSYERDSESGNDYAMTREYVSRLGRFSALDPLGGDTANPQTLNRYTYAGNNPISAVDPTGTTTTDPQQSQDGTQDDAPGTPHDLPADPTAGAPMGTPDDLPPDIPGPRYPVGGGDDCLTNPFLAKCVPDIPPPGDDLGPDDLGVPGGPLSVNPGGTGKGPLSRKDQARYEKLKFEALIDILNPDCLSFLESHGVDPAGLEATLLQQMAYNGTRSTITQGAAGVYITNPNQSIAQGFQNPGPGRTVGAAASITSNDIYFHQGGFLSGWFGNSYIQEGTIEHEALHNDTGLGDSDLQAMLGVPVNTSDTTDITQALKDHHCAH